MITLSRKNLEAVETEFRIYLRSKQYSQPYINTVMSEFGAFVLDRGIEGEAPGGDVVPFPGSQWPG